MNSEAFLYFAAGLGVVFFGIKIFTESLQSLTGPLVRNLINKRTDSPVRIGLLGVSISLLNFSSMGLSNMTLGYVNAGLMSLSQSLNLLLASQVGLTIVAWFLAVVGDVAFVYSLLALGFLSSFLGNRFFIGQLSKTFFSVGLVLMGMEFLDNTHTSIIESFTPLASMVPAQPGFFQSFFLVAIASLVITSLCRNKILMIVISYSLIQGFHLTAFFCLAVIVGVSVGASIPQLMISRNMSSNTKRSAWGYLLLEVLMMVLTVVLLEPVFAQFLDALFQWGPKLGFAILYSTYSFLLVLLYFLIGKLFFHRMIESLVPEANYKEAKKLQVQGGLADITTALAFDLIEQELKKMSAMVEIQLDLSRTNLVSRNEDKVVERKVSKYEKITDNIDLEISHLIERLMQRSLQEKEVQELRTSMKISDELESIADSADELLLSAKRIRELQGQVPSDLFRSMRQIGSYIQDYYIQFFSFFMEGIELPEGNSRLKEKIQEELEHLKAYQKELVSEGKGSADLIHTAYELYHCFSQLFSHTEKWGEALLQRSYALSVED